MKDIAKAAAGMLAGDVAAVALVGLTLLGAGCAIKHLALELDDASVTGYGGQATTSSASATSSSAGAGEQKVHAPAGAEGATNSTNRAER